jgi:glycosyltransferase involved in cell wall biosynthesis
VAHPRLGEVTERQTRHLADLSGIEVEVVAPVARYPFPLPSPATPAEIVTTGHWNGIAVHWPRYPVVPKLRSLDALFLAWRTLPLMRRIRERFPFDVIAAQYFWPEGPAARRLSRRLGVPFSIKGRGPDVLSPARIPSNRRQMIAAARGSGGMLAVSHGLRKSMIELGMPGERIEVHYTGADHSHFYPRDRIAAKAALGLSGPVLLISGNIIQRKGQIRAVEALAQIPDATLLIAGRGPGLAALERRTLELGLEHRVRLLGAVDHAAMPLLNAAADVTLLPSRGEGLANAWVDSLCCGTPVVTTDVCGARETIDRPEAGRIVADNPAALAEAVREILADPPLPEAVARAADKFSWECNARELETHLRRVAFGAAA